MKVGGWTPARGPPATWSLSPEIIAWSLTIDDFNQG